MKRKGKITPDSARILSPYESEAHKTEQTATSDLNDWIRDIIKERGLDLWSDVETIGGDRKLPDLVIYESRRSHRVLCVIEAKQPYLDVFNYENLKEPAWRKANRRQARYFATTNFKELVWFDVQKVNEQRSEEEQIIDKYQLSELENLDQIEEPRFKGNITKRLQDFLSTLYAVHTGKEAEPRQSVDQFLIYRLHSVINTLSRYYTTIIYDRCHKDEDFATNLRNWFVTQGWSFAWQRQDFEKAARQTAYLLVNKILFYNILQSKRPQQLDPLEVPASLTKGSTLKKNLQGYFDEVLKIDYDNIYTADFIDTIAFPDEKEVVKEIRELVNLLGQYDFSKLGDIIGPTFERLIPQSERHNLGQYFTNNDIVDLILAFCLKHEDDKVFDPACGAGTFLVRAYQHKKLMNQRLGHEDILNTLWGNDIAKFPVHLSTINLAIRDLGVDRNYPNVLQEDFFTLLSSEGGLELPAKTRRAIAKRLDTTEREITYPRWFDLIVGNPPYTRQEEMPDIAPQVKEHKENIMEKALKDTTGRKIADISKRAGIHAYFFVHGTKFLREGGRFGFIVSNSWLDVDYGKGLQEFFLTNYKIIAIIESKVERWFEEADVNTCIVILEKCRSKKARDDNLVRFVCLFQPLRHFIPSSQGTWQEELERRNQIDKLIKTILAHNQLYQNEELRIFPISQARLWEEGFDRESRKYTGAKWGKYLRAPEIFFKVLEKGKDKLVPLKEVAEVKRGFTTGANEFFYLTEEEIKRKGIEREFWMHQDDDGNWVPNYVIKSPRKCRSIVVKPEDLPHRVLMIHKDKKDLQGTNVLKYIEEGERKGYHLRPTCASRERWYDLGTRRPYGFLHPMIHNDCQRIGLNLSMVYVDHNLFEVQSREKHLLPMVLFLVSTVAWLIRELGGRVNLGEGALKTEGIDIEKLYTLKPSLLSQSQVEALRNWFGENKNFIHNSLFSELGVSSASEVSLDKVKPDRRELDKIIMGEILGLTEEEQLEVYRAVIDLVKSRLKRAQSLGKKRKTKEGIDIDLLVRTVMDKLGDETLGKFYREKILSYKPLATRELPKVSGKVRLEQDLLGWRLSWGKQHFPCNSETEARYLKIWMELGFDSVEVPQDEDYLRAITPELEALKQKTEDVFQNYLSSIVDSRTRQRLLHQLWQEVMR